MKKIKECVKTKRDLERVGGDGRTAAKDRTWRQVTEAVVRDN